MHRFSSAAWWEHLAKHVAGDATGQDMFDTIVRLRVRLRAIIRLSSKLTGMSTRPEKPLFSHRPGSM
jgi:hypothetical protein